MSEIIVGFDLEIRNSESGILQERIPIKSVKDYIAVIERCDNDNTVEVFQVLTNSSEGPTLKEYHELMDWSISRTHKHLDTVNGLRTRTMLKL